MRLTAKHVASWRKVLLRIGHRRDTHIYFFPFTEFDGESLCVVSREGGDESKIMDLRPLHPISDFFDVSPQDQIVWVQYRQSKHELWLADLPSP